MNKEEILELIQELNEKQNETICIETKTASTGKPEKYYDTISSFSNTMGGVILFGVEEKKHKNNTTFEVVGVYDANDLQKKISHATINLKDCIMVHTQELVIEMII